MLPKLQSLILAIFILSSVGISRSSLALGGVIYAAAPAERGAFHVGGKGVYNYGYNTGDGIAKVEVRHPDGTVTGSYRYFDPLGRQIVRSYIADNRGFRVLGNELPVAPDSPAIGIPEAQSLTGAVEGTREFDSPNIVTQDETELLLQENKEALQSRFNEQNKNFIIKQQQQLQEQRENLEKLKIQNDIFIKQQEQQIKKLQEIQERSLKPNQQYSTYYSTLGNLLDSPYLYSPDNIRYDFPAGFAYHTIPQRIFLNPIGVKGTHGKLSLTAGHTSSRSSKVPVISTSNDIQSYYINKDYRRPYIIGHAK